MGDSTHVSWAGMTWNPWVGCVKKSPGCKFCYMYREQRQYGNDPQVVRRTAAATFNRPLKWAAEAVAGERTATDRVVFTCSWSDWNNPEADEWRADAWDVIRRTTPELNYLILTKLPERFAETLPDDWDGGWPGVGLGVSIENGDYSERAEALIRVPAAMRFFSIEPCLGDLEWFGRSWGGSIDWSILGGESDPGSARRFETSWTREFLDICRASRIAPHIKQVGSNPHPRFDLGGDWKGGDVSAWPEWMRVQEFPRGWPTPDPVLEEQQELFG